jgi:hypothetical protein
MSANTMPLEQPQPVARLSPAARITGVLFNPQATFVDIVAAPTWIVPLVLLTLLSLISVVCLNQRMDWRQFAAQQLDKSPRAADLSADQKEKQIDAIAKFAPISAYVFGVPAVAVVIVLSAALLLAAYNLLAGANVRFVTAMAIVSHAFLASLVSTVIFLLVIFLKPRGTIDIENPVATNLGVLVAEDAPKWLMKLAVSIDIFSFWIIILIATGFAAANPRKLTFGSSLAIVGGMWALYVVLRVGAAWIFS